MLTQGQLCLLCHSLQKAQVADLLVRVVGFGTILHTSRV